MYEGQKWLGQQEECLSFVWVKDKSMWVILETVFHTGDEGQNQLENYENCLS